MALGVGIFRPEGGAEGINIPEGLGKGFPAELAADNGGVTARGPERCFR